MKSVYLFLGILLSAILACGTSTKSAEATITTFIDDSGKGILPETYKPLPNTLVIAKWNVHGNRYREVKLTDQNGQAKFSVGYTHFFDVSVFPPCGYYSTTPLIQDVTNTEKTQFGFWSVSEDEAFPMLSTVKALVWKDLNLNGTRDSQEEVNGKASIMFETPGGMDGNVFTEDNFIQETDKGWFDINLGNSCGSIYMLWQNDALATNSVSEPGKISDVGNGNPSIEIPLSPGLITIYWEIK